MLRCSCSPIHGPTSASVAETDLEDRPIQLLLFSQHCVIAPQLCYYYVGHRYKEEDLGSRKSNSNFLYLNVSTLA